MQGFKFREYIDIFIVTFIYLNVLEGTLLPSYRDRTDIVDISKLLEERKKQHKDLVIEMAYKEELIMEKYRLSKKYEIMEDMATELRYAIEIYQYLIKIWYFYQGNNIFIWFKLNKYIDYFYYYYIKGTLWPRTSEIFVYKGLRFKYIYIYIYSQQGKISSKISS